MGVLQIIPVLADQESVCHQLNSQVAALAVFNLSAFTVASKIYGLSVTVIASNNVLAVRPKLSACLFLLELASVTLFIVISALITCVVILSTSASVLFSRLQSFRGQYYKSRPKNKFRIAGLMGEQGLC